MPVSVKEGRKGPCHAMPAQPFEHMRICGDVNIVVDVQIVEVSRAREKRERAQHQTAKDQNIDPRPLR